LESGTKFLYCVNTKGFYYELYAGDKAFMQGFYSTIAQVLYVDTGDVLTLIAGIAIVIVVAVIANPPYLSGLQDVPGILKNTTEAIAPALPHYPEQIAVTIPVPQKPVVPTYTISLTDKPFTFPVYRLPENMETFGASEIPSRNEDWVTFAFIENTGGGLTQVFSVPYPVWMINTTIFADNQPQYAKFRMALCYADTGGIIKGEEILHTGTSYRIVRTSNTSMYLIISAENIDSYSIRFETPKKYYDAYP
jgi:hypothetical protein